MKTDVEPHRRIERSMLVQAQPGQITVEVLGVFRTGKITTVGAPICNGATDTVNQLTYARFAFRLANFPKKVLAHDDVGRQLAPLGRDFAIRLFEQHTPILILDGSTAQFPGNRIKRIID